MRPAIRMFTAVTACLAACAVAAATTDRYEESDFARVDKIDTHVHLGGELPVFMARAEADGFRLLTINVNYRDFASLADQRRDAIELHRRFPSYVAFAATFDAAGSDQPGWLERTQKDLDAAIAAGAVGVKVWKDIGMQQRDADGKVVMIDDPRFTPIFRSLARRGIVLLGHQGEPRNAWLPLEEMTVKGDHDYFAEHPQYHMFQHPEWPSYEAQLAARDRMLDHNPGLNFVGVHLASLEWNVDEVARFLDRYPNASVDLAARLVHLERQSVRERDKVRAFFIRYQRRILYGTDISRGRDQSDVALAAEAHEAWVADWRFLAGDSVETSAEFDGSFQGLALPRAVIDAVYAGNARRVFPTAWQGR